MDPSPISIANLVNSHHLCLAIAPHLKYPVSLVLYTYCILFRNETLRGRLSAEIGSLRFAALRIRSWLGSL